MTIRQLGWGFLAALFFAFAYSAPASAQATRTWVSGVGDDLNPCSRTAPCKTFAGAISKTAAGGEINCLDPGGFGNLTINKSITIDCTGTFGSVLNAGGVTGFIINDSATASPGTILVIIRGVSINGAGSGIGGVRFISGKSLFLDHVTIQNNNSGGATGVFVGNSAGVMTLSLEGCVITRNGTTSSTGAGVVIAPTGTGSAKVSISNSNVSENPWVGVYALGNVGLNISNTTVSNNNTGVVVNGANANLTQVTLTGNSVSLATAGAAVARVGNSMISGNDLGISGNVITYGNNQLSGNGVQGSTTPIAPARLP